MGDRRLNRRELLAAGAAGGAAVTLGRAPVLHAAEPVFADGLDFATLPAGDGWPGWACPGAATLTRRGGLGVLVAATDVVPCDPRPVAFAVDRRFRDGEIEATAQAAGVGAGVVVRRAGPRDYYAAVYDEEAGALVLLRRAPDGEHELARAAVVRTAGPLRITLGARGSAPTTLTAALDGGVLAPVRVTASDGARRLQGRGDAGVLATARSIFPTTPEDEPAAGNARLLLGTQEGAAFLETPAGRQLAERSRTQSTAAFTRIAVRATGPPESTPPSVMAATTGAPLTGGATLRVASDLRARVQVEISTDPRFRRGRRRLPWRLTGRFDGLLVSTKRLPPGRRVYWRARLRRRDVETVGPTRSFRVLPPAGSGARVRLAIGSCASQFGPVFDRIAERRPDVFVWQGDLNYPDTMGPVAQTVPAYAGIWRDFLASERLAPILDSTLFAVQRDDHDYGVQDANAGNLVPWGLEPWEALMERRPYYRFSAGLADVWVLDQRREKSSPEEPDTPAKTLLGLRQRAWLLRTLAASRAPFKVICSPCTLAPLPANARDGSWAEGFTAERDLLLAAIRRRVSGRTVFVTGDTHWTLAYDRDGLFEARPCPLGIPTPNDITLTQPDAAENARRAPGVVYADDTVGHVAILDVSGAGRRARLDLALVRADGAEGFRRRFEQPLR